MNKQPEERRVYPEFAPTCGPISRRYINNIVREYGKDSEEAKQAIRSGQYYLEVKIWKTLI